MLRITAKEPQTSCFVQQNLKIQRLLGPRDFPGGSVVKNPPADAGDMGSIPGPGRSYMLQSS